MKRRCAGELAEVVVALGILLCTMPSAWAVVRPQPAVPYDEGAAATPEPYVFAMLAGGLGMVGGYISYRIRKNKAQQSEEKHEK